MLNCYRGFWASGYSNVLTQTQPDQVCDVSDLKIIILLTPDAEQTVEFSRLILSEKPLTCQIIVHLRKH